MLLTWLRYFGPGSDILDQGQIFWTGPVLILDVVCFSCEGGLRSSPVRDAGTVPRLPAPPLQERLVLLLQAAGQTGRVPRHPVGLHPTPEPR